VTIVRDTTCLMPSRRAGPGRKARLGGETCDLAYGAAFATRCRSHAGL
jgi:hypothetical protein